MKKRISLSISKFYLLSFLLPVVFTIFSPYSNFLFTVLISISLAWILWSLFLLFTSLLSLFFNRNNQDKKSIIFKKIKKYFLLFIISIGLFVLTQIVLFQFYVAITSDADAIYYGLKK